MFLREINTLCLPGILYDYLFVVAYFHIFHHKSPCTETYLSYFLYNLMVSWLCTSMYMFLSLLYVFTQMSIPLFMNWFWFIRLWSNIEPLYRPSFNNYKGGCPCHRAVICHFRRNNRNIIYWVYQCIIWIHVICLPCMIQYYKYLS